MIHLNLSNDTFLYIQNNRPSQVLHSQFFDKEYYDNNYDKRNDVRPAFYWWSTDIDVRIAFIQYLITLQP